MQPNLVGFAVFLTVVLVLGRRVVMGISRLLFRGVVLLGLLVVTFHFLDAHGAAVPEDLSTALDQVRRFLWSQLGWYATDSASNSK
jgi:amino acid permease